MLRIIKETMTTIFEKYKDLADHDFVASYSLGDCYTVTNAEGVILDLDVAVALLQYDGNVSEVARVLKRSRRVVDTYISRDLALQELLEDIYDTFVDEVEQKARQITRAGDSGMMKFMLSTIGKKRGYVTRVEATGKDGKDLNVHFYLPENGRETTVGVEE